MGAGASGFPSAAIRAVAFRGQGRTAWIEAILAITIVILRGVAQLICMTKVLDIGLGIGKTGAWTCQRQEGRCQMMIGCRGDPRFIPCCFL